MATLVRQANLFHRILIQLLRATVASYQAGFNLLLGSCNCCRFEPSCSVYAEEVLRTHGPGRSVWLIARRLLRCRPGGPWGFDPVPPNPRSSK